MGFKQLLQQALTRVDASKLAGINAVCQLEVSGEGGGVVQIKVRDGTVEWEEGTPDLADIVVSLSQADFASILGGELNAVSAFMSGRLKIDGDMSLVFELQKLLGG